MSVDVQGIRRDFPILERQINGRPMVYMDSAATSLKPHPVINAVCDFYRHHCANIHRGVHQLSQEASELYEDARYTIARFIGAMEREVVLVRNASEALNLLAHSLPVEGAVLTSVAEHHSNMLPWERRNEVIKVGVSPEGVLDLEDLERKLATHKVGLVSIAHITNGLGVINPVKRIGELARAHGAYFVVDGSQSVPHMPVNVHDIGCDALAFSGHKMLGPSGVGVLYARAEILERMSPFLMGGDMISEVHVDSHKLANIPWKFEAGTPNIEGTIGLGAAVEYLDDVGMDNIRAHEKELVALALEGFQSIRNVELLGPRDPDVRGGVITFKRPNIEAHAFAKLLSNRYSILVRSGFHCAQPLFETLGSGETCRASLYLYNTHEEVQALVEAVDSLAQVV